MLPLVVFLNPREFLRRVFKQNMSVIVGMLFGLFLCTANSCWSSMFVISEVKDLPYLVFSDFSGIQPSPYFVCVILCFGFGTSGAPSLYAIIFRDWNFIYLVYASINSSF